MRYYRLLRALSACAALLGGMACSPGQHATPLPWFSFDWGTDTIAGTVVQRSTILIPVTVEGLGGAFAMQLDTGSGWPLLYEVPYHQFTGSAAPSDSSVSEVPLSGSLGTYAFASDTFLLRPGFGDTVTQHAVPALIGTIGLRFFRHRTLLLDLAGQRMAILDSATPLPPSLLAQTSFAPIDYHDGWALVPFSIGGRTYRGFFYDTGANTWPLIAAPSLWQNLTALAPGSVPPVRRPTRSWGNDAFDVGAPLRDTLVLAGVPFPGALIFRQESPSDADFFAHAPPGVVGTIGNALFAEHYVVILDLAHRRFGLLPRDALPSAHESTNTRYRR